jgi:hypothetical protein
MILWSTFWGIGKSGDSLRRLVSCPAVHPERDPALGAAASTSDVVGSSDPLVIECQRVLQRERMAGHLDDRQYSETGLLLEAILERLTFMETGPAVK